jgi:hypothetical protein
MKPVRVSTDALPVVSPERLGRLSAVMSSIAVALAVAAMPTASQAQTTYLGAAGDYAVFQADNSSLTIGAANTGTIEGNVALGTGAPLTVNAGSAINGTVYAGSSSANVTNHGTISGGVSGGATLPSLSTLQGVSNTLAGMAATQTVNSGNALTLLGSSYNITLANSGLNVINLPSIQIINGGTLTITGNGSANQLVVFNISAALDVGTNGATASSGSILLSGLTASQVLFNVVKGGGATLINAASGSTTVVNGTLMDVSTGVTTSENTTLYGAVIASGPTTISGSIQFEGFQDAPATAPELPTMVMAACGCVAILCKSGWRRRMRGRGNRADR